MNEQDWIKKSDQELISSLIDVIGEQTDKLYKKNAINASLLTFAFMLILSCIAMQRHYEHRINDLNNKIHILQKNIKVKEKIGLEKRRTNE